MHEKLTIMCQLYKTIKHDRFLSDILSRQIRKQRKGNHMIKYGLIILSLFTYMPITCADNKNEFKPSEWSLRFYNTVQRSPSTLAFASPAVEQQYFRTKAYLEQQKKNAPTASSSSNPNNNPTANNQPNQKNQE